MSPESLVDHYLRTIFEMPAQQMSPKSVNTLIDSYRQKYPKHSSYQFFFQGEAAFWKEEFEMALRHYLKAKQLPQMPFCCFRASAYLSEKLGKLRQAKTYAQKALAFYPLDPMTLALHERLVTDHAGESSIGELHQIFKDYTPSSELFAEETPPSSPSSGAPLPTGTPSNLKRKLDGVSAKETRAYARYLEQPEKKAGHSLLSFFGREKRGVHRPNAHLGIYLRLDHHGIVLNPTEQFLDQFHESGYRILDIDTVIVTGDDPRHAADLLPLYQLNRSINETRETPHTIRFYGSEESCRHLKTQFGGSVVLSSFQCGERGQPLEKVSLCETVSLRYFSCLKRSYGLMIDTPGSRLGFVLNSPWSPMLPIQLKGCDLLCLGIGRVSLSEMAQNKCHLDCLGYRGALSIIQQVKPELVLCTDFECDGIDWRLDVTRELRHQTGMARIFPADAGFSLNTECKKIHCPRDDDWKAPEFVRAVKSHGDFSKLEYLSSDSLI